MKKTHIFLFALVATLLTSCLSKKSPKETPEEIQWKYWRAKWSQKMDTVAPMLGVDRSKLRNFYLSKNKEDGTNFVTEFYSFYTTPTTADTVWHTRVMVTVSSTTHKPDSFAISSITYGRYKETKNAKWSADQYTFFNLGSGYFIPGVDSQNIDGSKVTRKFAYERMLSVIGKENMPNYDMLEKYAQWYARDTFFTHPPELNFYYGVIE